MNANDVVLGLWKAKHDGDLGTTAHVKNISTALGKAMTSTGTYFKDAFDHAKEAADDYLRNRLAAPVKGVEDEKLIIKTYIDTWLEHVNIINSKFVKQQVKAIGQIEKDMQDDTGGKKKGLIGRTVGKVKDATVDATDKGVRTVTFGLAHVKERRDVKL